jgi:hypothetical protein
MPVSLASVHGWTVDKPPEPGRVLSGRHARKARKRGGLLLGYVLLATQEKVTRAPQEHETLLAIKAKGLQGRVIRWLNGWGNSGKPGSESSLWRPTHNGRQSSFAKS